MQQGDGSEVAGKPFNQDRSTRKGETVFILGVEGGTRRSTDCKASPAQTVSDKLNRAHGVSTADLSAICADRSLLVSPKAGLPMVTVVPCQVVSCVQYQGLT